MRFPIALLTDALAHLSREQALEWCAAVGLDGVELGVGGYSPAPHVELARTLDEASARRALASQIEATGLRLVALNASGNPLHPTGSIASAHDRDLRGAIRLAGELGVPRVVAMSGCPGGPGGGGWPVFAGGAWLPDMEGLWEYQWELIASYWGELSSWAAVAAPGVSVCLELHPGTSIYNSASFARLRSVTGENVAVNLDPSHFWWQGIDPVLAVRELGPAIRFVHGKDTLVHPERVARHGVLDFRWPGASDDTPWHFCAVGGGRPIEAWAKLVVELANGGYDGPISIEHEDPSLESEEGVETSLAGLRGAFALFGSTEHHPGDRSGSGR